MVHAAKIRPGPQLRELVREVAHSICAYGNIVIMHSAAPLEREFCQRGLQAILRHASAYPAGIGLLIMVSADEPPPSDATRQLIRDSYSAMKEVVVGGVLVLDGEGFVAAAKRSIMTLISGGMSQPFPMRVASTVSEGATKLSNMLGARLDPMIAPEQIVTAAAAVKNGSF
jgi:hypothetical protein